MGRFYGYFVSAYGTFWLIIVVAAFVSQSHINAGAFGLCGFPIIAFLYALIRFAAGTNSRAEIARLEERIEELEWEAENPPT